MAQKGKWKDATRLPTVTVHGNYNRKGASAHSGDGLATALNRIPIRLATPMSGMGHGLDGGSNSRKALKARLSEEDYKSLLGGPLNPQWVEWFMGWPIGATDLQPLEMDKCHSAPQWHFGFWLENMRTNLRAAERLLQ
jgi:DNA (cytosine-5)-methyltransferase 1